MSKVPADRRAIEWHDPERDPRGLYLVDYRIDTPRRPIFVFALPSDDKVELATITLHQIERWGISHRSVGIFEEQETIARKVLARFSDIAGKQFSSLQGNEERISEYLTEELQA